MVLLSAEKKNPLTVLRAGKEVHHFLIYRKEKPMKSFSLTHKLIHHVISQTAILDEADAVQSLLIQHIGRTAKAFQKKESFLISPFSLLQTESTFNPPVAPAGNMFHDDPLYLIPIYPKPFSIPFPREWYPCGIPLYPDDRP